MNVFGHWNAPLLEMYTGIAWALVLTIWLVEGVITLSHRLKRFLRRKP